MGQKISPPTKSQETGPSSSGTNQTYLRRPQSSLHFKGRWCLWRRYVPLQDTYMNCRCAASPVPEVFSPSSTMVLNAHLRELLWGEGQLMSPEGRRKWGQLMPGQRGQLLLPSHSGKWGYNPGKGTRCTQPSQYHVHPPTIFSPPLISIPFLPGAELEARGTRNRARQRLPLMKHLLYARSRVTCLCASSRPIHTSPQDRN